MIDCDVERFTVSPAVWHSIPYILDSRRCLRVRCASTPVSAKGTLVREENIGNVFEHPAEFRRFVLASDGRILQEFVHRAQRLRTIFAARQGWIPHDGHSCLSFSRHGSRITQYGVSFPLSLPLE